MALTKNFKIILFVLIILLSGAFIFYYSFQPKSPPLLDLLSVRQELLAQPNLPANFIPSEITARQKLLNAQNFPSNLTPEQIKARQATMRNN